MSHRQTPNFDPVARIYRWAEYLALGPLLVRTRNHFLPQLTHCRRALVLGDGDGRFLARLLRTKPELAVTAVDTSAAMLGLLRSRCMGSSPRAAFFRLRTQRSSALTFAPHPETDLIVTHFFLDCLSQPDLDSFSRHLAATTSAGTLWLLSDFGLPSHRLLRWSARQYIRLLYLAFRVLTGLQTQQLPDIHAALSQAGFVRLHRCDRLSGLLYTELWQRT